MITATTVPWTPSASRLAALGAEFVKLRTVRATWTTLLLVVATSLALAAIVAAGQLAGWDDMTPAQRADLDPVSASLVGVLFATALVGSLGVRTAAGEYATGMIDVTLTATPRRATVLTAKAVVVAVTVVPVALVSNVLSFLVGQAMFADRDLDVPISDPAAMRAIAFGTMAVSAVGVLGVALGGLLRRSVMATSLLSVAIVGSQLFAVALPDGARRYLPGLALEAAVSGIGDADLLSPAAGLVTVLAYAAAAFLAAYLVAHPQDRPRRTTLELRDLRTLFPTR